MCIWMILSDKWKYCYQYRSHSDKVEFGVTKISSNKTATKIVNVFHCYIKGMEHVPNIFMSFDKYLFLEVINIVI